MRIVFAFVLLIGLSSCGGGGEDGSTVTPPPVISEVERVSAQLATRAPLPVFPLTPPTVDAPLLDAQGVMLDDRNGTHNPAMIARFALERYSRWRTNQPPNGEDWIKTATTQTDWLAANIDCKNGVGVWRYQFPASFDAQPGWVYGFANSHAVAALLIMSRFIPDPQRYIEPALCAIQAFDVDVAQGGMLTQDQAGKWFEEYAVPSRPGVLNGHVFALAGLDYACSQAGIAKACGLFDAGVAAMADRLPRYDAGFTSRYSLLTENYASPGYNGLHSDVLNWLARRTGNQAVKRYADIFQDYSADAYSITASFTTDPINHGVDQINDGNWWYGYWSSYGYAPTLDIDLGVQKQIRALAIGFAGTEPLDFEYGVIAEDGSVARYERSSAPQNLTRYTLNEFQTAVGIYPILINARRIRLRFPNPISGTDVVALREVNILY